MNKIITLTDQNFKEKVLEKKGFALIDFWAPWCNPCKILAPILEEIAEEYNEKLIIGKINIEEQPNTAPIYSIRSIPTLLLFHDGQVLSTKVGALSKLQLKKFLDENIN
ncbi:thioredoxin TrxA [Buchnera aphidicola]|uniref:Thioredoxin n=1 Tax=Buchnera aphidicola str. USDA (Myzus persicae) TaxID=1009856 RepID=W0NZA5_BUCMP|nr:thioredoxin TrxA [Buchnera aphidicola]AHG59816.1 Trxa [Buchnera aphidicola str. USDA (Myzus persicae)]AHG60396.1 Trxa [Buchnera aphidicola str. W106 (Myzus persicae)]AHG60969.1 Trxa [Buchnera aphidicola str. G002 (Myzus persicae)]AHG61541.1 Trxa [Buchnera aphidicola str. F009 (Myzus persicae)]WAI02944.1 MAG: thioredoxin TrxA [Buchnera aphidicola (Myzus persicae)]